MPHTDLYTFLKLYGVLVIVFCLLLMSMNAYLLRFMKALSFIRFHLVKGDHPEKDKARLIPEQNKFFKRNTNIIKRGSEEWGADKEKEQDEIKNFFEQFTLIGYEMLNNISFMLLIIFLICNNLFLVSSLIPNKWQSVLEFLFKNFTSMSKDNLDGFNYFPLILTLFFLLISSNLLGLLPYNITITSLIIITFGLSFSTIIGATLIGFKEHLGDYLSIFMPGGAPLMLSPLLVLIESISYISRAISLGVRLAANLSAGHLLFAIIANFGFKCLKSWFVMFPIFVLIFITVLEIAVAGIQAYVFCLLTAIYLGDAQTVH